MNLIARQLEVYAESWKKDYLDATRCWRLEQALALGISLFALIKEQYQAWRRRVAVGIEAFSEEENNAMRSNFEWWLQPSDAVEKAIRPFEAKGYAVDRAKEFRDCCTEAKDLLNNWTRPVRSRCQGYLEAVVTDEEAERLNRMINSGDMKIKGA